MNNILPCIRPTIQPVKNRRGSAKVPSDIKSLITATNGTLRTLAGPSHAYSAATGQVPDGLGGVQVNTIPPVHSAGYYAGPAYTNLVNVANSNLTIWTQRGTTVVDNGDGSYRVTLGVSSSKDIYRNGITNQNPHMLGIKAKKISGGAGIRIQDTLGSTGAFSTTLVTGEWVDCVGIIPIIGSGLQVYSSDGTDIVVDLKLPQVVNTPYILPFLPANQSVVSTVGTTGGNGIQVPLTGSDAADRLFDCFRGALGADEIISNGTFDSDTGWTKGTGWTISGGKANHSISGINTGEILIQASASMVSGRRYKVSFTVSGYTGSGAVGIDGASGTRTGTYFLNGNGLINAEIVSNGTALKLYSYGTAACSFDDVSAREIAGAVGTVGVLMKMGAGSGELPDSTVLNLLSVKGASSELLFSSTGSSGEDNIGNSNDGATTAAVAATAWTRDQYLILAVEYSGTKFRVGAQRYTSAGVAVDADLVFSHATLAGGATFDGSWNPTTFERLFLNNTVPNHFKARFVSNQAGLGSTEIIRRLRKYGKF